MKYAALFSLILLTGCSASRIHRTAEPVEAPAPEPTETVVEAPPPPEFAEFKAVNDSQAVALWGRHFTVGALAAPNEVDIPQPVNPIRMLQRFEVWRGSDFIGMSIVETVTDSRVRARFDRPEDGQTLRAGDRLITRLWRPDRPLGVAAHGTFSEPNEIYTKEELKELLESAGCEYRERVEPGVDLVILGSNLLADEWYRRARNDLRFETMREDDVRAYFLPPE